MDDALTDRYIAGHVADGRMNGGWRMHSWEYEGWTQHELMSLCRALPDVGEGHVVRIYSLEFGGGKWPLSIPPVPLLTRLWLCA